MIAALNLQSLSGSGASSDLANPIRAGPNDRNGSRRLCDFTVETKANTALSQLPARWRGLWPRPKFAGTGQVSCLE